MLSGNSGHSLPLRDRAFLMQDRDESGSHYDQSSIRSRGLFGDELFTFGSTKVSGETVEEICSLGLLQPCLPFMLQTAHYRWSIMTGLENK